MSETAMLSEPDGATRQGVASARAASGVTVVLPVKNVSAIITACLESLRWAEEVLLVDGQSTDGTLDIAAGFPNVRVVQHPSKDIRVIVQESQGLARHPWIFWFCADEVCTPELGEEIRARTRTAPPEVTHFTVPSHSRLFGTDFGGGERFPRLWRQGSARFPLKRMHEMPDFVGRSEALTNIYWHIDNPNIRTILPKYLRYEYTDARAASDAECARINPSMFYQLARFNYFVLRTYWPHRKRGVAAMLCAMSEGMGQLIRHLLLVEEARIRRGETIRDTHGWGT
jgi:glycosyltransferase involved in cell wall biosynthesis